MPLPEGMEVGGGVHLAGFLSVWLAKVSSLGTWAMLANCFGFESSFVSNSDKFSLF